MTAFDNLYNACDGDNIWDDVPDVDELMRLASAVIKTLQLELAKNLVETDPRPRQCSCGCSHIIGYNDDGPCGMWKTGANGRCVYCDHSKDCHESVGRELWRKQNDK